FGRMGDERDLYFRVLAADPLQSEKEERFRELTLGLAHAAGNVDCENHRSVGRRPLAAYELAKAQVVVGERRRVDLDRAPTDRLLDCAPAVETRARSALVPAFAHVIRVFLPRRLLGLQIGKLELFPQPVEHVFDFELQYELEIALSAAR